MSDNDIVVSPEWQSTYRLGYLAGKAEASEQIDALKAELEIQRQWRDGYAAAAQDREAQLGVLRAEIEEQDKTSVLVDRELDRLTTENEQLRAEVASLQEIAVRVKLGQLDVWPDASKTEVGRALTAANKQLHTLIEAADRAVSVLRGIDDYGCILEADRLSGVADRCRVIS